MLFLAVRYLLSRKKQAFLTLLGVIFGSAAFVVVSGVFLGAQEFLIDQIINNDAHIHIYPKENILKEHTLDRVFYLNNKENIYWKVAPSGRQGSIKINNPPEWFSRLKGNPYVVAFAPILRTQVIITKSVTSIPINLYGIIPNRQSKVTNIENYMLHHKFNDLGVGGNRLIIGKGLLNKLGACLNDVVHISSGNIERQLPFKIIDIFNTGIASLDDTRAYAFLGDVQKINNKLNQINEIAIKIEDYRQATDVANNLMFLSSDKVQSWNQQNANFLSIFKLQDFMRYVIISVILLISSLGVYNTINIIVNQKKRDIAVLSAMGFTSNAITLLFFSQGLIFGVLGGLLGLFLGHLSCVLMQMINIDDSSSGNFNNLIISMDIFIYIKSFFISLIVTSIASIIPARVASTLMPIEIIRESSI